MTFFYSVDLPSAAEVVASLSSVESSLDEVVVDLRQRLDHLHTTWSGSTAGAHLVSHASWSAAYEEMHEALAAMRRTVRAAAANYTDAVEANEAMWSSVR